MLSKTMRGSISGSPDRSGRKWPEVAIQVAREVRRTPWSAAAPPVGLLADPRGPRGPPHFRRESRIFRREISSVGNERGLHLAHDLRAPNLDREQVETEKH